MIQLLVLGLLCSAAAINGSPVAPPQPDAAAEARRLVHQSNWASVGTLSTLKAGYPMVSVLSTSDSKVGASSTGDIYFLLLDGDLPTTDVKASDKVTFMFSDAQEAKCTTNDPMGHRCPRTMISGEAKELTKGTDEYTKGLEAYVSRHPFAGNMTAHTFKLCKLEIEKILVFSGYGGYRDVPLQSYNAGQDGVAVTDA